MLHFQYYILRNVILDLETNTLIVKIHKKTQVVIYLLTKNFLQQQINKSI